MIRFVLGACCALLAASTAGAQEIVRAGAEGSPPAAADVPAAPTTDADQAAHDRAIGEWAQRVLSGAPAAAEDGGKQPMPAKAACAADPASDGKPHGEVWAGVGTRGYREVGGVVTQPLGKCGSLTIAVDRTEGNFGRRGRR
ncbi:MAG TPA: hypothetical protein VFH92_05500 [Phenylobacterium sp.]|nr:hypothetical protein [Phenylobacterium sp.]